MLSPASPEYIQQKGGIKVNSPVEAVSRLRQKDFYITITEDGELNYFPEEGAEAKNVLDALDYVRDNKEAIERYLRRQFDPLREYDDEELPIDPDDTELWQVVLKTAWKDDLDLHGLLHGLRCECARLEAKTGSLKLRPGGIEDWEDMKEEYLKPKTEDIKWIFNKAESKLDL